MPASSHIRKLHLLVQSEVFVRGALADKIFSPEGKIRWLKKHAGQDWRPEITKTNDNNSRFDENAAFKSRFVVFQIQIVDDRRGPEIRGPSALTVDHASKLSTYVTGLLGNIAYPLDGHDLIRLAAHLGTPMFTHPEQGHQRDPFQHGYYGFAPMICRCWSCCRESAWQFEAKEEDIEILDEWKI